MRMLLHLNGKSSPTEKTRRRLLRRRQEMWQTYGTRRCPEFLLVIVLNDGDRLKRQNYERCTRLRTISSGEILFQIIAILDRRETLIALHRDEIRLRTL